MRSKFYLVALFGTMFLMSLLMNSVPKCSAQSSALNITYDEYNWTSGMKRVGMTTPEKGLIFKITISNNSSQPLFSPTIYIVISIEGTSSSSQDVSFSYTITATIVYGTIEGLYLPPKQSQVWFVNGTEAYSPIPLGDYTAKLSYFYSSEGPWPSAEFQISPYPLDFKVETPQAVNQAIAQSTQGTTQLTRLFIIILVLVVVIAVIITLFVAKRTNLLKKKRGKLAIGTLWSATGVFFTVLSYILTILSLIKL
jgi:hypothetical protein